MKTIKWLKEKYKIDVDTNIDYAVYKGDKFLFIGTKKECAEFLNVSEQTVMFYTTPTYRNRGLGEQGDRLIVIRIEED